MLMPRFYQGLGEHPITSMVAGIKVSAKLWCMFMGREFTPGQECLLPWLELGVVVLGLMLTYIECVSGLSSVVERLDIPKKWLHCQGIQVHLLHPHLPPVSCCFRHDR